ncbi:MAG: AI-2E family transporter [Acidobacteriota bacterium]
MAETTVRDAEYAASGEEAMDPVPTAQLVAIDPASPTLRSTLRVVIITLIAVGVAGYVQNLIASLSYLFFLVVLSIFFAYLLDPIVRGIRRPFVGTSAERYVPRTLAIFVAYFLVFAAFGIAIATVAPRVAEQARDFGANIPEYGKSIQQRANDLSKRFDRLRVPDEVQADVGKKLTETIGYLSSEAASFLLVSVTFLPWLVLIPILAFFFLKDVNLVRLAVLRAFPAGPLRIRAESILQDVNMTLAAYIRAQLTSCLVIGLICTVGFYVIGLRYALLLGILAGVFEFVPLLGPAAIGLLVIITVAASDHPERAIYVAIFLVILRLIQDYVLYPRIVRGGVHLHPLAIILSVLAGEQIAGIPGVFLAIPIVAVATVIYKHLRDHKGRHSLIAAVIETETTATEGAV